MPLTAEITEEVKMLAHYNLESLQEGIKVHHSASSENVSAAKRLFDKGLTSQDDGGYLTDLGVEAAQHVQSVLAILKK
ncbi:MAG: TIGR02647 family protein [Methylococcales bacterium]|nr:TIGR02647 family protein [Methylococcales bacterium]